jgi:hypothetical protein
MMNDQNDSNGGENFDEQLQDAVEPEEEGEVNENESHHGEYLSDEDSRVEYDNESDDEDDDVSKEDESISEEEVD